MIDTLRSKAGDHCLLVDGNQNEAEAVIEQIQEGKVRLRIEKITGKVSSPLRAIPLCVYVGMPQKQKADEIVRMLQELGIEKFFPLESEHSQVKISRDRLPALLARWQKITREAAKQSGSLKLMELSSPMTLEKALGQIHAEDSVIIFHPGKNSKSFREWIEEASGSNVIPAKAGIHSPMDSRFRGNDTSCHLFFGPEGGFSEAEIIKIQDWAKRIKFSNLERVHLGESLLRVDTAVAVAAGAVRLML